MKLLRTRKGQTIVEYAILVVVVATALIATSIFVRRGMQAQHKIIDDEFSDSGRPWPASFPLFIAAGGGGLTEDVVRFTPPPAPPALAPRIPRRPPASFARMPKEEIAQLHLDSLGELEDELIELEDDLGIVRPEPD